MKTPFLRLKGWLGSFGVRARLLTLLLPGILSLLALDSSNDYQSLQRVVNEAYDEAMLESEIVLRRSVSISKNGQWQLNESYGAQEILSSLNARHRYFHIGLTPHDPSQSTSAKLAEETTLLGQADFPSVPAALFATTPSSSTAQISPVWYDGGYRASAVRIVASRSLVTDRQGRTFDLLVQVAESKELRNQAHAPSLQEALARDARMFVLVILLVWLGIAWSLQPLEKLRKSVLLAKGTTLAPLASSSIPYEVAPLVHAINEQIAGNSAQLARQTQFLTDASHQLKTPLAIMMTQAEVALREKDPALQQETLRAIVVQIRRSKRLCEQLLSLAHTNDQPPIKPDLVDLNAIAKEVVMQHLSLAHEKNQDLGWTDALGSNQSREQTDRRPFFESRARALAVPVRARPAELYEALANLVHNAIAHTPANGNITVAVTICGDWAIAEVIDNGPGIEVARRTTVFERFHAGVPSQTAHQGAGLGLAIARAYARRNGGDINLEDARHEGDGATGLNAFLRLPIARQPATRSGNVN